MTLNSRGTIYMNGIAYDAFDRPAAVEMLYEDNHRVIGLKPVETSRDRLVSTGMNRQLGSDRMRTGKPCVTDQLRFARSP